MKHTSKEELIERFRAKFKNKNVIIPEPILVFRDMYAEQTDGHVIGLRYNYHKKEIQAYVKKRTAPYKYPRIVVFRDSLPKTTSGKIQRSKL